MEANPEEVIRTEGLTRLFGDFVAVDQVSFGVDSGEVVGFLGPNGSGKTTTIRMLLGLLLPSSGSARVLGYDATRESEQVRSRVGYMSQKFALYHDLTVRENLAFYAGVYGVRNRERLQDVLDLVGLRGQERLRVANLSVGWRQRLALGTAIIHSPRLLFLDEPTSGVDPGARRSFWDLIYRLVEDGVTAFVTTHYMDEAEYCGRVGIMRAGKLLAMDAPESLKTTAFGGRAWDISAEPLLPALASLQSSKLVERAGLAGDHLRAVTTAGVSRQDLALLLQQAGAHNLHLEAADPSLEDVFLFLAGGSKENV